MDHAVRYQEATAMLKRLTWTAQVTPLRTLALCVFLVAIWYGFTFLGEQQTGERTPTKGEAALMRTTPAEPPQSRTIDRRGSALLALPGVRKVELKKDRHGFETVLLMVDPHRTNPSPVIAAGCDVLREHGATWNILVQVIDADKFAADRTVESLASMTCNIPQTP
jgi:hypothetical protein